MKKNVVILGGSYAGAHAAQVVCKQINHETHQVLIIEQTSHMVHRFVLPRYSVVPDHEHKAFIPYRDLMGFNDNSKDSNNTSRVIQARGKCTTTF